MFENTKLVICDIDGTLVVTHQKLSERARKAIEKLREHGILFGVASGRNIGDLSYIVGSWGVEDVDVIIGLNGSELYDGIHDKTYKYFQMEPEWIKETFDIMRPFNFNPVMYYGKAYMCGVYDTKVHYSVQFTKSDYIVAKSEEDFYREPNAKIMFRVDEKDMPAVEARAKEFESPYYKANKTQATLMEFQNRQASKAYALDQFCQLNGFTLDNIIAFGDTTNDNEMLKAAGIGVCMVNGSDDTKAMADIITEKPVEEDGWVDFIENVFFKEKGW
ncbi:MAG: HAD family hydrolase [Erysipelotrichaceae bacterium]|nr:HAD family hydrolase [Erysipelotrichaceae bacterium]